jgi:5-methylcytosine-specific restriction endonuclease McrA
MRRAIAADVLSKRHTKTDTCSHGRQALHRRVKSNGVVVVGWYCHECTAWREVPKALVDNINGLPEYDAAEVARKLDERLAIIRARYDKEKATAKQEQSLRREQYYRTQKWMDKRQLVLSRDRYTCQAQLRCQGAPARDIHHVVYRYLGDEPLWDLRAVCRACHDALHDKEGTK